MIEPTWPGSDPEIVAAVDRLAAVATRHAMLTQPHLMELRRLLDRAGWWSSFRLIVRGPTFAGGPVKVTIGPVLPPDRGVSGGVIPVE